MTETDQEVEKLLITGLRDKFPGTKFIGEESVAAGSGCVLTSESTWIIDPIDGTTNFVSSNPNMCTILGYMVNKVTLMCFGTTEIQGVPKKTLRCFKCS